MLRSRKVAMHFLLIPLLLTGWGYCDSTPELAQKLVSGRSARTIPHRFTIAPSGVSLTPNQTQHFGVTDAQGNSVVVHWNVSGLHCSGLACGNIDANGNYTPPTSLSQPLEVTLEGVVVSDPNYSVMTHVQIVPGAAPIPAPVGASNIQVSDARQVQPAPVAEKAAIVPSHAPQLNQTVTATAQSVAADSAKQQIQQPPAQVIGAAPKVESHAAVPNTGLLSLPNAVAAAPAVNTSSNSIHQQMPLPNAVAAAPVVKEKKRNSGDGMILLDLPSSVSNLTAPKKAEPTQSMASSATIAPGNVSTANKAASSPAVTSSMIAMSSPPKPPVSIADANARSTVSVAGRSQQVVASVASAPALPSVSSVATTVSTITPSPTAKTQSQSAAIIATPAMSQSGARAPLVASVTPAVVTKPAVVPEPAKPVTSASNTTSAPGAGVSAAPSVAGVSIPPAKATEATPAGTVVTYREGKLKIDAENITLAEVLQLVAKKMGAIIDVPPGSGQERIVEHVGPGYPNDVLTRLLNGSHFNFIIVNSALHPNEPAEVLLSMQGTDTGTPAVAAAAPAAAASSVLYTPPDPTLRPLPLPPQYDSSLNPPPDKESLTPDAISQLMREKARELRERAMQQAGGTPDASQPPAPQPAPEQ